MGNQWEKNYIKIIKLAISRAPYSISVLVKNKNRSNEINFKNQKIIERGTCFQMKQFYMSEANGYLWSWNLSFMMEDHSDQPLSEDGNLIDGHSWNRCWMNPEE